MLELNAGSDNAKWYLDYISAGVYEIVSSATGYVLTNNGGLAYTLYALDVERGEEVILGTNGQSSGCVNCTVLAVENSSVTGDMNSHGQFNVADVVMLQK